MNISHEVILDLLPVYLSGDASPATRELVDSYLAEHAAFSAEVRRLQADDGGDLDGPMRASLPPDLELRTLGRTRTQLRWQRWLFGLAIGFTTMGLSTVITFNSRGVSAHLLLRDYPGLLWPALGLALACWVSYFRLGRRFRTT